MPDVVWRLHLSTAPAEVWPLLATDAGRQRFWAERSHQAGDSFELRFPNGVRVTCVVHEATAPRRLVVSYFDGSRLAFSSSRTGQRNIWWTQPDLTRPVALTSGAAHDEWPAYSPDGSQVAFVSDRDGRRGIWIVAADGGTPRFVAAAEVLNGGISWSPDGKRLVYSAPGGGLPQIERVDVGSGRATRLPTQASASAPAWSPVEDVIAYIETQPDTGGFLRFMTGDGRPLERARTSRPEPVLAMAEPGPGEERRRELVRDLRGVRLRREADD